MKAWDPSRRMLSIYRVRSRLDDAAAAFDANITDTVTPQIGTPVEVTNLSTTFQTKLWTSFRSQSLQKGEAVCAPSKCSGLPKKCGQRRNRRASVPRYILKSLPTIARRVSQYSARARETLLGIVMASKALPVNLLV